MGSIEVPHYRLQRRRASSCFGLVVKTVAVAPLAGNFNRHMTLARQDL